MGRRDAADLYQNIRRAKKAKERLKECENLTYEEGQHLSEIVENIDRRIKAWRSEKHRSQD